MTGRDRRQELRTVTMAELERFMDWERTEGGHDFADIEQQALAVGRAVSQALMKWAVSEEECQAQGGSPSAEPRCEACQKPMRDGGRKWRVVQSKAGRIELARRYYYCPRCRRGVFPPGPPVED